MQKKRNSKESQAKVQTNSKDTQNMPSGAIRYPNFLTQKKKHGNQLRVTASDYMIGEANKKPAWVICLSPSVFTPQQVKEQQKH